MTDRYPLQWPQGWPRTPAGDRARAKFHKMRDTQSIFNSAARRERFELTIHESIKRVSYELGWLGIAQDEGTAIISSNLIVNRDGWPRADQREPADPGVAVYWQAEGRPMRVIAIDLYDRARDNLAAIAATLEALRKIARHGGAQVVEHAFTGFDALPGPDAFTCWALLGIKWDVLRALSREDQRAAVNARWRDLARLAHPDQGGSHARMSELNAARDAALQAIGP
jgi:hypothetical protein